MIIMQRINFVKRDKNLDIPQKIVFDFLGMFKFPRGTTEKCFFQACQKVK